MTSPPTHPRYRTETPFVCRVCSGPCRAFKGDVHGWTCAACLAEYVGRQKSPTSARNRGRKKS